MCLHPEEIPPIPDETVRVAKAAFPKSNLYMRLRDELGILFQDVDFASVYPLRGQSAQAPWRLAMILIMQFLENLSDRQAASSVRARIDWKYALSLELTDSGFDFSVLSEFRDRLICGGIEQQILDKMLTRFQDMKLLSARGKQRTDSTQDYDIDLLGPVPVDVGWQSKAGLGFDLSHFQINWNQETAYCPQGKSSSRWKQTQNADGNPIIRVISYHRLFSLSCALPVYSCKNSGTTLNNTGAI